MQNEKNEMIDMRREKGVENQKAGVEKTVRNEEEEGSDRERQRTERNAKSDEQDNEHK